MTYKRIALLSMLYLSASTISIVGAEHIVRTLIKDQGNEPVIYATIRIFNADDSVKAVILGTTDESGKYIGKLKAPGDYTLTAAMVGKSLLRKPFKVSSSDKEIDLGELIMEDGATALNEVTVTALRPIITQEIDRITYNVKEDPESNVSSLREVLRKVPLVTVDEEGNIQVKGSSSFKIYKNGRPNNSYSQNAKELFKAIPAASIKKIEVITAPGAREDAEGDSPLILNIITDSQTAMKGVMGMISGGYSFRSQNPSFNAYLTTQIDRVTMSVNGGFFPNRKTDFSKIESGSETKYLDSGNIRKSSSISNSKSIFGYWSAEGSWEPDTLNLLSFEFTQYTPKNYRPDTYNTNTLTDKDGNILEQFSTLYGDEYHSSRTWLSGSVNYQRNTRRKDEAITLSYNISYNDSHQESDLLYTDLVNWKLPYRNNFTDSKQTFTEHTFQLDWTRPYFTKTKLDLGAKLILRRNHSDATTIMEDYLNMRDDFIHKTTVGALYADWRINFAKWSMRAGLRYEYSYLSAKYLEREGYDEPHEDYSSRINDFVPNVSLMWRPTEASSFNLSFNRNIRRPGINYLDPHVNISPTSVSYGNPDLKSANINNLSFEYNLNKGRVYLNTTLNYRFCSEGLMQVQWLEDDIFYSTYSNVGVDRNVDLNAYLSWRGNTTRLSLGGNFGRTYYSQPWFDANQPDRNEKISRGRWNGGIYMWAQQRLPWKLNLSGYFNYFSGYMSDVFSYSKRSFKDGAWYGISLSRQFLKDDRLSVSIHANVPFGPYKRRWETYSFVPGSESYNWGSNKSGDVSVRVSWTFGKLRATVRKTNARISNSDMVGGNHGGSRGGESQGGN